MIDPTGGEIGVRSEPIAVVEHISHRTAVMYLGKIVEIADKTTLFTRPQHPYTGAGPRPRGGKEAHHPKGDVPSPINAPAKRRAPETGALRRSRRF